MSETKNTEKSVILPIKQGVNFKDAYECITNTIADLLRAAGKPTPSDNANIYDDVYAAIVFISMLRQAIHHYIETDHIDELIELQENITDYAHRFEKFKIRRPCNAHAAKIAGNDKAKQKFNDAYVFIINKIISLLQEGGKSAASNNTDLRKCIKEVDVINVLLSHAIYDYSESGDTKRLIELQETIVTDTHKKYMTYII